jgi:hypothetical protein
MGRKLSPKCSGPAGSGEQQRSTRFTLAFDDASPERDFLDQYADSVRLQVRGALIVVIVILLALAGVDPPGDVGFYQRIVRYAVGALTVLPMLALTFAPPQTFRRAWAATTAIVAAVNMATMPAILIILSLRVPTWRFMDDRWQFSFYEVCVVNIVLLVYTVSGLRFVHASAVNVGFGLIYAVTLGGVGVGVQGAVFVSVLTGVSTLVGAFGGYRA